MRKARIAVIVATFTCVAASLATPAGANGGAYIELDRTYYLPGASVSATSLVYVPDRKVDLLERGPFWLYAVPRGSQVAPGRPIPSAVTALAPLTIRADGKETYELTATFTMPSLPAGEYRVSVCNEPCTLSGFGEPLSGTFFAAQTQAEIDLRTRNEQLAAEVSNLERVARKHAKEFEELELAMVTAQRERDDARLEVVELRERLESASLAGVPARPLIDRWTAILVALGLVVLAAALVIRRRGRAIAVAASVIAVTLLGVVGAPTASAGGSWLELRDVQGTGETSNGPWGGWAAPGATVSMRGTFGGGAQAHPSAGPWTARLRADTGDVTAPLGPVALEVGDDAWVARVTFVVPDVPSGTYWVDVCDAATCTEGVGDLIGGTIIVASTSLEGELLTTVPRLEARLRQLEGDRRQLGDRLEDVEAQLERVVAGRDAARADAVASSGRAAAAERRVRALGSALGTASDDLTRWRFIAFLSAAVAIVAFATLMARSSRRRRDERATVPDTPEELLTPAARP